MGRLFYFIKNDIKIILDRKFWRKLVFPLFLLVILSSIFSNSFDKINQIDKISISVIDNDNTYYSKNLVDNFIKNENFSHLYDIATTTDILSFEEKDITAYIIIPKGFSEGLVYFQNPPVKVILNKSHTMKSLVLKNTLDAYGDYISAVDSSIHTLYTELKKVNYPSEELEKLNSLYSVEMVFLALGRNNFFDFISISEYPSVNSVTYFLLALTTVMIMYLSNKSSELIQYERDCGIFLKSRIYNIRGWTYILSKAISTSVITFIEIMPFFFVFDFALGIISINLPFIVALLAAILVISNLNIFIGLCTNNMRINKVVNNIVIFVFGILGGSFIPLAMIPRNIIFFSKLTPVYWINIALLNTVKNTYPIDIFIILSMLIVTIYLVNVITYRISYGNYKEQEASL